MSRFGYLAALGLLVLNDHVLKQAFPGFLTGKLSDFAGVFVLAVFLAFVLPRKLACALAGLLFVWWKSPLSDGFIAAMPWESTRVIDWSDLTALLMLPLAYRASNPAPVRRHAHALVAVLSLFAFAATSPAREDIAIPEGHALRNVNTGKTWNEWTANEKRCGAWNSRDRDGLLVILSWTRFTLIGPKRHADAWANAEIIDGQVRLHFTRIHVRWDGKPDAEDYREQLAKRLERCLKK